MDVGINFWKDPIAESCCICGDGEDEAGAGQQHTELTCPYNYLAPSWSSSYVPCRARTAAWREGRGSRRGGSEHRWFLRRFVRATNLPRTACCCHRPADVAGLFAAFGPLRMWHVAMDAPGACVGVACVVFERREDAEAAVEALNCSSFRGRRLRVDWAYPSA